MAIKTQATLEDLYHVPENGKAEIVNGEIRLLSPTGALPNRAAGEILVSLRAHARKTGVGRAYTDNAGFVVDLPNRKSFSPDAAYHLGPDTRGKFLQGAPIFAVEVRSEEDYGPAAEEDMAAKRNDYFAAGTQVVWDVDVLRSDLVNVYRATDPLNATVYRRGKIAEAEPAVPGWTMPVNDLSPDRTLRPLHGGTETYGKAT
jgi:Uma2 family endonuclease